MEAQKNLLIDTWTLNYIAPNYSKYLGKLSVYNDKLEFRAQFDTSLQGLLDKAIFQTIDNEQVIVIQKDIIENTTLKTSFLKNQVVIKLKNNEIHSFDYGILSVKKIHEAINQK